MSSPDYVNGYPRYVEAVGRYLGYGTNPTGSRLSEIDDIIRQGLHQFYFPTPMDQTGISHRWSFLEPWVELELVEDQSEYELNDDFAGVIGEISFNPGTYRGSIRQRSYQEIRDARALRDATGTPYWCAIRTVYSEGEQAQGHVINFYPTPDQEYTIQWQERKVVRPLSEDNPHPYGGDVHDSVILESCLSVAELRLDDTIGPHHQRFLEMLRGAIGQDKNLSRRDNLGYNGPGDDHPRGVRSYLVEYAPDTETSP